MPASDRPKIPRIETTDWSLHWTDVEKLTYRRIVLGDDHRFTLLRQSYQLRKLVPRWHYRSMWPALAGHKERPMILIGQYDSPFVRRVAIAMRLYRIDYEHRPWSTFGDADRIAAFNPLRRVPTPVLDNGEALIESGTILDHLDETVGPSRAMIADTGDPRRHALKVCALATGLADKAVSLTYERVLHQTTSDAWIARCMAQIGDVLAALESDKADKSSARFWFGDAIGHADIAVACALRFTREAHPGLFDEQRWPVLAAHAATCEGLKVFQVIAQPFLPPA
jgi:glutathione S-transferase